LFFDRPESGEVSILVHISINSESQREDPDEFEELAISAGALPAAYLKGSRKQPSSTYFIGSGKLEELSAAVEAHQADLVLFNHSLSPSQERNLEKHLKCRVLDRTGLILDIFAQRARSHEGKLQVELAQLDHLSSRLTRGWTHLDRQKGGIGMRGAGEKQLELDQRMIRARIKGINKSLTKVRGQREQGRRARKRAEVPTVSLVGYTNAGKSTLFNQLTKAQTFAADQLFATLDSTLRKVNLPSFGTAIMADTVGFISHLPHGLVEAFRATLEETAQASLLLHVIDASNDAHLEYVNEVNKVLTEIKAGSVTQLEVMNKIDLTEDSAPHIQRDESGKPVKIWVSAKTGVGMDLLLEAIGELLGGKMADEVLLIAPNQAKLRSQLYEQGYIEEEQINEEGLYQLRVRMPAQDLERLLNKGVAALLNTCTESQEVAGEAAETLENNIHTATN